MPSKIRLLAISAIALGLHTGAAHAQAWVGLGGSLSASLDYNYSRSNTVVDEFSNLDQLPDNDDISSHTTTISVEYTPIDRLAVSATVPILTTLYFGTADAFEPYPAGPHGRYDDGNYHTTLQDFRFTARYMVLELPVAIAPHLGFSVPMTNYETVGFAGAGRGLNQLHLGLSIGKFFQSGVPNLYLHGTYEFSLAERYETSFEETADFGQNRSDIKATIGYFITDKLEVNIATDYRLAHGGFRFEDYADAPVVVQIHHDPLLAESFLLLGAGVSYQVMEQLRLGAFFRRWTWGENTRNASLAGVSVSYDIL